MSAESLKDKYPLVECDLLALDSPKVSFDISLVQKLKGKTINYSPENLDSLLGKIGVADGQQNLNIVVGLPNKIESGSYSSGQITIGYGKATAMDRTLKHEIQHHVDGPLRHPSIYRLGQIGVSSVYLFGIPSVALGVSGAVSEVMNHSLVAELMSRGQMLAATVAAAGTALSVLYWFDSSELRARRSEKIDSPPIFSVDKRPVID